MSDQFALFRPAFDRCRAKAGWDNFSDDEKIKEFADEYAKWLDENKMEKRSHPDLPEDESVRRTFIQAIFRELGSR